MIIIHGTKDTLILPEDSDKIYGAYGGSNKRLIKFDGSHNSFRPLKVWEECLKFLQSLA
jgi:hypothetical protein